MSTPTASPALPANFNFDSVLSWSTTKTAAGYSFRVYAVEHAKPTLTVFSRDGLKSREMATHRAKAWVKYFKSLQRQGKLAP